MPDVETDVVVVGAGVVGCSAARELARDHDVVVLEKGLPAAEATGFAGGVVSPATFYPGSPRIATHSTTFFDEFDGTGDFRYVRRNLLELVPEARETKLSERVERLAAGGVAVSYLDRNGVADTYPQLDVSGYAGALEYRDTGWVDPYTYAMALLDDARRRGTRVRTETPVTDLAVENGTVTGVESVDGRVQADHVVVAAGWRTRSLLSNHVPLPIRPWEFSIAILDPEGELSPDLPMALALDEGVYFRPERNGTLLVGDGDRPARDPEQKSSGVDADESFREDVAAFVPSVLPELDDAEMINHWTGIEGVTPDARPIVDTPDDGPEGLVVAQASAMGIMTSPTVAVAVRSLVTGVDPDMPIERFALDRFDTRSVDFEIGGIVDSGGEG